MAPLEIFSLAIGVFGTGVGIFYGRKSARLERRINRFHWIDVENGIKELVAALEGAFKPDVIMSVSGSSSVVANLFININKIYIPLITALSMKKGTDSEINHISEYVKLETANWNTFIPNEIARYRDEKILIIDDVILTGDTLMLLRAALISMGFKPNNIRAVALCCTELAESSSKGPNHYSFKVPDHNFFLPWGRSCGGGNFK